MYNVLPFIVNVIVIKLKFETPIGILDFAEKSYGTFGIEL